MVTDDSMSSSIYIWHAMRTCKVLLLHALKKDILGIKCGCIFN